MKSYDEIWAVDADRTLGSMTMPQTRIIISGENADELYRRFCLRFMTAGG